MRLNMINYLGVIQLHSQRLFRGDYNFQTDNHDSWERSVRLRLKVTQREGERAKLRKH